MAIGAGGSQCTTVTLQPKPKATKELEQCVTDQRAWLAAGRAADVGLVGKRLFIAAVASTALIFTAFSSSWADEEYWAAVMRELPGASVSLDEALKTSEQEGKPISAEYDVEDGGFQISIYVERDGHFREVIVDPRSGTINTTKPITIPQQVDEAQAQNAALSKAKLPLTAALATAVDLNSGYRAVSIMPLRGDDEAVVTITLMKGEAIKQVAQKLD